MEITTVPVYYLNTVLGALEQRGWDRTELLRDTNFSGDLLAQEKARIPRKEFVRFTRHLAKKLNDESIGLIQQPMKLGTFAMLCHSCVGSETLGRFLGRGSKFSSLTTNCVDFHLTRDGDFAEYSIKPQPGKVFAEDFFVMLTLSIIHRLASWSIDQKIVLKEVNLCCPRPYYAKDYNLLFMAPIHFDQQQNSIRFHSDYLDANVTQSELSLRKFLSGSAVNLMTEMELDSSLTSQIRNMIRGNVAGQFPSFEQVASSMNFTTATLRRRLKTEGSNYQDIKDAVRRDIAIFYLGQSKVSVDEIAEYAGFSDPTSFFRAFKRWTGTSPRAYTAQGAGLI